MHTIAIFSTLANFDRSYSLVSVIVNQARMLKEYSENNVEIWVMENCRDDYPEDLKENIRKIVPVFTWEACVVNDGMVPIIQNVLQDGINRGVKNFLCHDIILVDSYITYNEAMRRVSSINAGVNWYFWMHSGPHPRPAILSNRIEYLHHTLPDNGYLVYLNYLDQARAANMYDGVTTSNSYVVYNIADAIDISKIDDKLALEIANRYHYNDARVRCIYPFSTTRMDMKNVSYVLEILDLIKKRGLDVKFMACNCHANALSEFTALDKILNIYTNKPYTLNKKDIIFTSKYNIPEYSYSIPHSTVVDLFKLSNLFIFPTLSEVCPLVLQEAALTNNLIVLNSSFPPLAEIVGFNGALHFPFGSILSALRFGTNNTYEERINHFNWVVDNIIPALSKGFYQTNAMYNVIRNFSPKCIWESQYKPMLNI